MAEFSLHERLAADTIFLKDMDLCHLLLMNDSRFPWVILVPRVPNAVELFDLNEREQMLVMREVSLIAAGLKAWAKADKINIAALGNMVAQLHVHVIARKIGDLAWPSPVWNAGGSAIPYPNPNGIAERIRGAM